MEEWVKEVIRLAYLKGIEHTENGNAQWCHQGSKDFAEEFFHQLIEDGVISI